MAEKNTSQPGGGLPSPLARLYERAGLPAWPLPRVLADVYGGDLGFRQPCVYANFVASVDGVTALGPEYPSSGSAISGHDPADRFVMGLLQACADVVLSVRRHGYYLFLRYTLHGTPLAAEPSGS